MIYHRDIQIEFNHCDPAGIVFYPRYFEMTNSVAENFFREVVGVTYAQMMQDKVAVPTAHLEADFHAPSRLGEVLDWQMQVIRLGGSSIDLRLQAHCAGQARLTIRKVLVWVAHDGRPAPVPGDIRARIEDYISG